MMRQRLKIHIQGAVQGVGFRPFIWRLATEMGFTGWVKNTSIGVFIEAEGKTEILQQFILAIAEQKPPRAIIYSFKHQFLDPLGYDSFKIIQSQHHGQKTAWILPDIATCSACRAEIFDPHNRRYLYPFTNCTHCGPRYSIVEKLPYDRQNTTMKLFEMCNDCKHEYNDPHDRRFHAQPNACPVCGPHVELWDSNGHHLADKHSALKMVVQHIRAGQIVAVKGLGGFHLIVDAANSDAIQRLRQRKGREEKPFALMIPDATWAEKNCQCSALEKHILESPEAPIVLLQKEQKIDDVSELVAPNNPALGVMLPFTPLHLILLDLLGTPIIATSGNLSDETLCTENSEALHRLGNIADYFLVHNRPIVHHMDDSIVRLIAGRSLVLRRARGYAPLPVMIKQKIDATLAVGGHLKNTIAIGKKNHVFISQHIGDLDTENALITFQKTQKDLQQIYQIEPVCIVHDKHPDYASTKWATEQAGSKVSVQHHYAHALSCMAENELEPPVLGVTWDGTGYGTDSTIWGGEFLLVNSTGFERVAHLRTFLLPGAQQAIKMPYRSAIGLLWELFGEKLKTLDYLLLFDNISQKELAGFEIMLRQNINCPRTSSAGRLFDAVASILNIQHFNNYEGQAPMLLEFAAWQAHKTDDYYDFTIHTPLDTTAAIIDWEPMIHSILLDVKKKVEAEFVSAKFHNTLAEIIVAVARASGENKIILSGGTFQNKYLTERSIDRLNENGFDVYTHQQVPPNDGGVSLGQIYALAVR